MVENGTTAIYYANGSTQTQLRKLLLSTGSDTVVSTRSYDIQALCHDRSNTKIWAVDCANTGSIFQVWNILTSGDSVTTIGNSSGAISATVTAWDIFRLGGDTYVLNYEERAGSAATSVIWDVDASPFVENVTLTEGTSEEYMYGTVVDDKYYTIGEIGGEGYLYIFDVGVSFVTSGGKIPNGAGGYPLPASRNQFSLSYDNDDLLYFILKKTADSKNYLVKYSISDTSHSILLEHNIALMLDRNCLNTANSPWEYEKASHITSPYIYQISKMREHLFKIQDLENSITINALTDRFAIDSSKNVYQYTNYINDMTEAEVIYNLYNVPKASFTYSTKLSTDQLIDFYQLSTNDEYISKEFAGKAGIPEYDAGEGMYEYDIDNLGYDDLDEVFTHNISAISIRSGATAMLSESVINYLWTNNSTGITGLSTSVTFKYDKNSLESNLYPLCVRGNAYYTIEPNGFVYMRDWSHLIDSGLSLTVANSPPPTKVGQMQYQYNTWEVFGGASTNAVRFSTRHEDSAHIQQYGKRAWDGKNRFACAETGSAVSALAVAFESWQGMQDNPAHFTIEVYDSSRALVGNYLTYQNSNYTISETVGSYVITKNKVDLKSTVQTITISQSLIKKR